MNKSASIFLDEGTEKKLVGFKFLACNFAREIVPLKLRII